jgi:ATP-dependent Clp protease ATP-binding subunit ClpA
MQTTPNLTQSINRATGFARQNRHEFVTPEHLLLALLDDNDARELLKGVAADIDVLRRDLNDYVQVKLASIVLSSDKEPTTSQAYRTMVQRAEIGATEAGKPIVNSALMLIAMVNEKDGAAQFFLRQQGITLNKLINFNTYGTATPAAQPVAKTTQTPANNNAPQGEAPESELAKYSVNLNEKAANGKIDPLVGRENEVDRIIQVMARRKKSNPMLLGDPGTGKTAIAEGLAQRIIKGEVPPELEDHTIYSLDLGAMMAGTMYRGEFEKRLKAVIAEVQAMPKAILLIDEIHTLVGAGATGGGSMDAANLLKPALSDGSIRVIGATTYAEYRKYIEKDAAIARRFQKVEVVEPSIEDAILTLSGVAKYLEKHHGVQFTPEAIRSAVELSAKYITDRRLPDKAIDVLDEVAASQVLLPVDQRERLFTSDHVEDVIAKLTNTPRKSVSNDEKDKMENLEAVLKAKVFGQDHAVETLVNAFQIARAGLGDTNKPLGSFMFDGPTGVGKTELAKQLSEELGAPLLRFDMSEYMEKHAVSRLVGSPPGYVGHDEGGQLTDAVGKNPHSIVLFDEVEKAHPDIFNILLQVLDYGALTDSHGKKVDFRNTIVILTTNVSVNAVVQRQVGFGDDVSPAKQEVGSGISAAVRKHFRPEFINRLDEVINFDRLPRDVIGLVADKFLNDLKGKLAAKNVVMERTEALRDHLVDVGFDHAMGARPMGRAIQELIKKPLSKSLLFGELAQGGSVVIDVDQDTKKVKFSFNEASGNKPAEPDAGVQRRLPAPIMS